MSTDRDEPSPRPSGYRFLFSPKWIGFHLLIVVLVVTMINLGFWQLRRLDHRRHFNAEVRANANQPVTTLDDIDLSRADLSAIEWRRVRVSGTYLSAREFLVVNRAQNGDTGRNVVDVLQLGDGSLLLVNRGFVPIADQVPPAPSGSITIVGRLRVSEHRGIGQPSDENVANLTEIHRIDIPLLRKQLDGTVLPMYVEQLEAVPPDSASLQPIAPPDTGDEGPHLSYAIQWFIFSGCAIVGWVLAIRRSIGIRSGKITKRKPAYIPIADPDDESVR
jgi:cytochrome oxidase assembly protein ShyY1